MDGTQTDRAITAVGDEFIQALTNRDFDELLALFSSPLRFRAMVPRGIREANQPSGAVAWYRRWFEEADSFDMQDSSVDLVVDRLSMNYRIRMHDEDGWQVIEQKAFCRLQAGQIQDMALVCSGFCLEGEASQAPQMSGEQRGADAYYDAGDRGCAEGPLEEISGMVRKLQPGQSLQVHANDPSVAADLPSWCRLAGHEFEKQAQNQFLIRKKG
jgi:TusA-related sulfurtransferase